MPDPLPHLACPHCGYDLTGTNGNSCPECGQRFHRSAITLMGDNFMSFDGVLGRVLGGALAIAASLGLGVPTIVYALVFIEPGGARWTRGSALAAETSLAAVAFLVASVASFAANYPLARRRIATLRATRPDRLHWFHRSTLRLCVLLTLVQTGLAIGAPWMCCLSFLSR